MERAAARDAEGSNSRYEEPEAEGMRPVLRTKAVSVQPCHNQCFQCSRVHTDFPELGRLSLALSAIGSAGVRLKQRGIDGRSGATWRPIDSSSVSHHRVFEVREGSLTLKSSREKSWRLHCLPGPTATPSFSDFSSPFPFSSFHISLCGLHLELAAPLMLRSDISNGISVAITTVYTNSIVSIVCPRCPLHLPVYMRKTNQNFLFRRRMNGPWTTCTTI